MKPINIIVNVLDDEDAILIAVKDALSYNPELVVSCFNKVDEFLSNINPSVDLVISDVRLNKGIHIENIIDAVREKNPNGYIIVMSAYMDLALAKWLNKRDIKFVEKNGYHWLDELKDVVDMLHPKLYLRAQSKDLFTHDNIS